MRAPAISILLVASGILLMLLQPSSLLSEEGPAAISVSYSESVAMTGHRSLDRAKPSGRIAINTPGSDLLLHQKSRNNSQDSEWDIASRAHGHNPLSPQGQLAALSTDQIMGDESARTDAEEPGSIPGISLTTRPLQLLHYLEAAVTNPSLLWALGVLLMVSAFTLFYFRGDHRC